MIVGVEIIPHPYTYLPARAEKHRTAEGTTIRWFDQETGKELPPWMGYGDQAQLKINEWYRSKRLELQAV